MLYRPQGLVICTLTALTWSAGLPVEIDLTLESVKPRVGCVRDREDAVG